jgi:arylsulfatase A-like enzyme
VQLSPRDHVGTAGSVRPRSLAVLLAVGLLAACRRDALPPDMTIEHVVEELTPRLAAESPPDGVRRGVLQPGDRAGGGAPREAVIAPPGTSLRLRLAVPADAALRFSAGVEGDKQRDTGRSAIEFRVTVDGREVYRDAVNPAYTRHDRRWFDSRVDLRPWATRSVDVVLETRAEDPSRPLAGTPGWSQVRLMQEERHARQPAEAGPNVMVLLVDTLRADRLGLYGATPSPSPTLDAFAARGLVFDTMVAQTSWTMPAVASIMTGLHPRSHGAVGPDPDGDDAHPGGTLLPDAVVTLAEVAQQAGITTVGVSSNMLVSRATNLAQGFETFVELPFDRTARDYAPASVVNRAFLDWLRRAGGLRFFAYLHYMEPHGPYAPPPSLRPAAPPGIRRDLAEGWVQDFARNFDRGRVGPPSPAEVAHLSALYDGDVHSWDDAFAPLLRALEHSGLLDRTVVVVVADHGEEFLEHGKLTHGAHLYEETIHVPLVMVGPGIPAGRRADLAQQIDVLPTVAALLGAPPPPGLPGRDLLSTHEAGDVVSEIVSGFGDAGAGAGTVALRTPRWKLIRRTGLPVELYDLAADPGEHTNVAAREAETAALGARLDRWASAAPAPPPAVASDPDLRNRLRQLGYVDGMRYSTEPSAWSLARRPGSLAPGCGAAGAAAAQRSSCASSALACAPPASGVRSAGSLLRS